MDSEIKTTDIKVKTTKTKRDIIKTELIIKFNNVFLEFISDIKTIYPEYSDILHKNYISSNDCEGVDSDIINFVDNDSIKNMENLIVSVKPLIREISDKDDTIFEGKFILFKDINFSEIWKQSLPKNREVIWKYLHTLIIISNKYCNYCKESGIFKDFFYEFQNMNEGQQILENMVKSLNSIITGDDNNDTQNDGNNDTQNDTQNDIEEVNDNMPGGSMFENTKIGSIAKELASEFSLESLTKDLGTDGGELDPSKFFEKIIGGDSSNIMNLIQNVGQKIQTKIAEGGLNETELMSEAQNMMKNLNGNGGLFPCGDDGGDGSSLLNSLGGLGGLGKLGGLGGLGGLGDLVGGNNDEDMDDLDKDIKEDNNKNSESFMPKNLGVGSIMKNITSQMGGGGQGGGLDLGNIQKMAEQMTSQMDNNGDSNQNDLNNFDFGNIQKMAEQMATQMQGGGNGGGLDFGNIQKMAEQMANQMGNSDDSSKTNENINLENIQKMAEGMANNSKSSKYKVDNNKIKKMKTQERLREKLERRKKDQEQNLYQNTTNSDNAVNIEKKTELKVKKKKKKNK
jgi:hypothetical protein